MHTSGLVITLRDDRAKRADAICRLQQPGCFVLGNRTASYLEAVLEAEDPRASQEWHEWAASLPGIENIEVAFVYWDEFAEMNHA